MQIFLSKFRPPPPIFSKGYFHSPVHGAAGLQSLYLVTSRPVWLNKKGQREIERKLGEGVGRCECGQCAFSSEGPFAKRTRNGKSARSPYSVVVLNKNARLRRFMFAWLVDLWRHRQRLLSVPAASLCQIIAAQVCHSSRPSLICPHFNFVVHVYVSAIKRCRENLATRAIRDCQLEFINSKGNKQTKHIWEYVLAYPISTYFGRVFFPWSCKRKCALLNSFHFQARAHTPCFTESDSREVAVLLQVNN